jgi:hypothetical protein
MSTSRQEFENLIARIRDHYVEQFESFVDDHTTKSIKCASEVKLGDFKALYGGIYCVDLLKDDGSPQVVELMPDKVLCFDPFSVSFGRSILRVESFCWDSVSIRHDLSSLPEAELDAWFKRWMDPEDTRQAPELGVIHAMLVEAGVFDIDFGTAIPRSLVEMLELLEKAGASRLFLGSSRIEVH